MRLHLTPEQFTRQANAVESVKCCHRSCHEGKGSPDGLTADHYRQSPNAPTVVAELPEYARWYQGQGMPEYTVTADGRRMFRNFNLATPEDDSGWFDEDCGHRVSMQYHDGFVRPAEFRRRHRLTDVPMTSAA